MGGGGGVESDYSVCPGQDGLSVNPVYISWDLPSRGGGQPNFIKLQKNAFSEIRCSLPFELWAWLEQKSGLEFSGDGTAGYMHGTAGYMVEKVKIVSVHVRYFSFFSFFSFFSLCQSGYVRLHQVTSVYVGGMGRGARQLEMLPQIQCAHTLPVTCHWGLLNKQVSGEGGWITG